MKITIKAARTNAGLTQEDAAKTLGVSALTLANYENGQTPPKIDTVLRMVELYNVPIEDLNFNCN